MKKLVHLFIVGFLLLGSTRLMAQCPPPDNSAGVNNFTTQTEIDNYIIDYPDCTELTVFVNIYDEEGTTDPITNLNGLANLERIDGSIKIYNTSQLTDLTGLSGLTEITGGVSIFDNTGLETLDGVENLTRIGTEGGFDTFLMYNNTVLTDINGLQNVNSGMIYWAMIYDNPVLASLEGMDNMIFDPTMLDFQITNNPNLSVCAVESICEYITGGGAATINGNAPGCSSVGEVTTACQINFPSCPEADVLLTTQAEVDQFIIDYPYCAVIPGTLNINDAGTDPIVNLDGLQNIQTVYGLSVQNTTLTDFSGLDALETISGNVTINNISLADVSFLAGYTTIAGSISFTNNAALTDISALSTLTHIDGALEIVNNDALTTLSGLDNIVANTITNLVIENNDSLSLCNMEAICIYLANGFPASISGNDTGCATIPEVEGTCDTAECPPADIEFLTQAELDYFAIQYPNCTQINGNVIIGYLNNDISDLQPLQNITSISGLLSFSYTDITDFNDLNNLQSVGSLSIDRNDNLTNFQGFDNLETISRTLSVYLNDNIETFSGLESLTSVNAINIFQNPALLNLEGLNNIGDLLGTTGGISLQILQNDNLLNIDALSGVTQTLGKVTVMDNVSLENITGLENLTETGTVGLSGSGTVRIQNNPNVSVIELGSLEAVYGALKILLQHDVTNLDELSSLHTVYGLYLDYNDSLQNVEGLSNLTTAALPGDEVQYFSIRGNPMLTSLTGFENIAIVGRLQIEHNHSLASYEGLSGLQTIGGSLYLDDNPLITDMSGFENLTATGVRIGLPQVFLIWDHTSLTNVEAFSNLLTLDDSSFLIAGNPQLTSLSGLDNIDPTSIAYLELLESENLSYCEVASICDFIATAPANNVNIGNNATGCNTVTEVEAACEALGVEAVTLGSSITLHPNPMQETLTISTTNGIAIAAIKMYDTTGKLIVSASGDQQSINVANLSSGIYFISIETDRGLYQQKLVK